MRRVLSTYLAHHQGQEDFIVPDVPETLLTEKLVASTVVPCQLCGKHESLSKMRNHVGFHILRAMRQESEILNTEARTE